MSNINKQELREEFQFMRGIYSDPADHERQLIYIAAEALLDELEAAEKRNADLEGLLEAEVRLWTQRYDCANSRREVAEKRIAELEAREVVLPQRYSMLHRVDFDEPYHTEMVYKQHQVLKALHDAGICIKVE